MKNILFIISLWAGLFYSQNVLGQCICSFITLIEEDPNDPCCRTIRLCNQFAGNPNCIGVPFETVQLVTNNFPMNTAEITSAVGGTGITASIIDPYTATFTSSTPYNSQFSECLILGQYTEIGTVCFENATQGLTGYGLSIISNDGTSCLLEEGEFPVPCTNSCEALFEWFPFPQTPCFAIQFVSQSSGAAPISYCWDMDGDSNCDYTVDSPFHQFPGCGDYEVCLTITDAAGCTNTSCSTVSVSDSEAPLLTCSGNLVVSTDPNTCTACIDPFISVVDNCDMSPSLSYTLTGATVGDDANTCYQLGTTLVSVVATDFCGNLQSCAFEVTVRDLTPPVVFCAFATLSTDPGECTATYTPVLDISDNCDPEPVVVECVYSQGTISISGASATLGLGLWDVVCTVSDQEGNQDVCFYNVLVEDNQAPVIQCPPNQTIQVPGCSEGSVAFFDSPIVDDNCDGVVFQCNSAFQSGDFFPCGTTMITCVATDASGLTATCTHSITINGCDDCAAVESSEIACTDIEGCYNFNILIENLTLQDLCNAEVSLSGMGLVWYAFNCGPGSGPGQTGTIQGQICTTLPSPLQLPIEVGVVFPDCGSNTSSLVLQPNPLEGKDASVNTFSPNSNSGAAIELGAIRWTIGSTWFTARTFLDFDWSSIPAGTTLTSAVLELSGASGSFNQYLFPCLDGTNDMRLRLVTQPWDESSITWNNKPAVSSDLSHQVGIPAVCLPGNGQMGDLTVDITALVQTILANPSDFHGFELSLQAEGPNQYRAYSAWSSDHPTPELRPKLILQFSELTCILPITFDTPCCEEISIEQQSVCQNSTSLNIPVSYDVGLEDGIAQLDWYVDFDCDGPLGAVFYQSSPTWSDLQLYPNYFPPGTTEVCIYAVASLTNHPCEQLITNTISLTVCEQPLCSISNSSQQYCYDSSPISVLPLELTVQELDCDYTIQWYANGAPINGATFETYQPAPLAHIAGSNNDCFTTYEYQAHVTSLCGTQICSATITLYNGNANPGQLDLIYPFIPQPFCPGQDATLEFVPECPEQGEWVWYSSTTGAAGTFSEILGAGSMNPKYNTNQLFLDTWYEVEVKNGVCPADRVSYFIDILPYPGSLTFTATPDDVCDPTAVFMQLDFDNPPAAGCEYVVYWYVDGNLAGTTVSGTTSAAFNYLHPQGVYAGNYYAIIEDPCCNRRWKSNVVTIDEPMDVLMVAPCFQCNDETVTLEGIVLNSPSGTTCTYQWYKDGVAIVGATNLTVDVYSGDATYTFEASCGLCTKSISYFLRQCGMPFVPICLCAELVGDVSMGYTTTKLAPLTYEFKPVAPLQACDEVTWDWGDGSLASSSIGDEVVTHIFQQGESWLVSMAVSRTDSSGSVCTEMYSNLLVGNTDVSHQLSSVQVYPNPSSGDVIVKFGNFSSTMGVLQILDAQGKLILEKEITSGRDQYPITISGLASGVYFLRVIADDGIPIWTERIVKQ